MNVSLCLQRKSLNVNSIRLYLCGLFQPAECIPVSEKLDEIFESITRNELWDYSHYDPIEYVVEVFGNGDAELSDYIESYKKALTGFYLTTKIVDYMKLVEKHEYKTIAIPRKLAKYDCHYCCRLSVKLRLNVTNEALDYVDRLWRKIATFFLLPSLTAILDVIVAGSVTITWLVPSHYIPKITIQLGRGAFFLCREQIFKMFVDNVVIYCEEHSTLVRINAL